MRKVQSRDAKTIGRKTVAQPVISLVPKKFPSTSRVLTHYKGKTTALDRKKKFGTTSNYTVKTNTTKSEAT